MRLLLFAIPLLAAAQQGAIEGVAFNKITGAPVPGVRIRIAVRGDSAKYYDAVTGVDGKYRIGNLPPGSYLPLANPPDGMYAPSPLDTAFKRIEVFDKAVTYDIPITPPSFVRGRVLDPDRRPAARARVTALPADGILPGMDSTDAEGRFSLRLAPGKYRLRVQPAAGGWAPTYYPNATDPSSAEIVVVGDGAGLDGLDIRLRPAATSKLSGIVRDDSGKPAPGVELTLSGPDAVNSAGPKAASGPDGAFEFTAVPPGEWLIFANTGRDGVRWLGATTVSMPSRDFDRAEVRIDPPFALDVEVEGLPDGHRQPLAFDLRPAAGFVLPYAQERDEAARFDRVYPGAYRIGVRGVVPGRYLKSILLGAADITGRQVDLAPGSPPLRFLYAPNGGRVSVEVENGAGARVVLLWADRDNYVSGADSFNFTCDDAGRFTMNDLRPGLWYALAFPASARPQSAAAIRDRVFNQGLWRDAASFRLTEGETATLKLKILP